LLFFGLLLWLLWVFGGFSNRKVAPEVFEVYSVLTFLYCLCLSAGLTADCISAERREGTLGLLFLTNLNSAEIMAGKFCSTALSSVYGLMAIFPMLSLPLMIGGITFGQVTRTVLGLLGGILFALAAGFLASVVTKRQFTAIALALGLTFGLVVGPMVAAAGLNTYSATRPLGHWVAAFSPLYTLLTADGGRFLGGNHYWPSAVFVASLSLAALGLTTLLLAATWRDRPKSARAWPWLAVRRSSPAVASAKRASLRHRLLGINPLFWLAARQRVSAPVFMCLAVVLTVLTVFVAAPFFGRSMAAGAISPVLGYLFAWFCCGLAIHALVLYYAAMSASRRLAEDKQMRALELILSTPTSERTISRGLWLAYGRKMFFPALLGALVHCFFIWMLMVLAVMEPPGPGPLPLGVTPGELFWSSLLDRPLRGRVLEWHFVLLVRVTLLFLLQMALCWLTLGWVGRWLGVRMKRPGFAPAASLALLLVPPILLFSLACYLAVRFHLDRWPDWRFVPLMMWVAVGIGFGHCLVLSFWAANCLRQRLRVVALSHYEPPVAWRWRLPSRRTIRRVALATAVVTVLAASLAVGYYGYQNLRARWAWRSFQASLQHRGESLRLASLLPAPAPDAVNFARSPSFADLLNRTNHLADLLNRLEDFDPDVGTLVFTGWRSQADAPLQPFLTSVQQATGLETNRMAMSSRHNRPALRRSAPQAGAATNRTELAAAFLDAVEPDRSRLGELAAAAATATMFQVNTNSDIGAVLRPDSQPIRLLERLHLVFQVRASAELAWGRNTEAAEDVLTGLRLAQLARQLPDTRSMARVQWLLARSLQPLWEGLSQQAWTEPQLAAFQSELAGFNLLADYTNAVRRVVLAHIELWRAIPGSTNMQAALAAADVRAYLLNPEWQLQPSAWWFDNCIRLYGAGQNAIQRVDLGAGRIGDDSSGLDLNGLPLDPATLELLQQWIWLQTPASVAFAQTSVNQALVACALERFRLANGAYPASLQPLVPSLLASIPHDAVSGRPIIYQEDGGTNFILRGVGPNGVDDRKSATSDDWLWTYSTNSPNRIISKPGLSARPTSH
jgi:hypothetical protein